MKHHAPGLGLLDKVSYLLLLLDNAHVRSTLMSPSCSTLLCCHLYHTGLPAPPQ